MTNNKWLFQLICAISLFFLSILAHADEALLGQKAEREGKLRQSLSHYVQALQAATEGSSNALQLREKIIKIARKLQPPPDIPEEAKRHMWRGEAALQDAKDQSDYIDAIQEYKSAVKSAPWLADAYFHLSVAQETAGEYKGAMKSIKFYILAAPGADNIEFAKKRLYKLEYRSEKANTEKEKIVREEKRNKGIRDLAGIWRQPCAAKVVCPDGYNIAGHRLVEVAGDELLVFSVWDNPSLANNRAHPGQTTALYRLKLQDWKLKGKTVNYDKALATQSIEGTVSKDYKIIEITYWDKLIGKFTSDYHRCKSINASSCGR